jgi:hypothetical protein
MAERLPSPVGGGVKLIEIELREASRLIRSA